MKWLKNLFSGKHRPKISEPQFSTYTLPLPSMLVTVASEPIASDVSQLSVDTLQQFVPLRDLEQHYLETLPSKTLTYSPQSTLFVYGQSTDSVFYLLSGSVQIQPDSASHYNVDSNSPLARLPLNSGKVCGSTATALDDVSVLCVPVAINRIWSDKSRQDVSLIEVSDILLPESIGDSRFFTSFAAAYRENKLRLPSLPDVAFKLKEAMQRDIGIADAAEIIHLDPPIVTKLIQVANSPLYGSVKPINNCQEAVARLGLNATRNLVMGISLKQLFACKDPTLMKAMQQLWRDSLYVSSLSFVLAEACSDINPEDALLAGLISDIGIIPLLHFAEQYPEQYPSFAELEQAIPFLRGPVGSLLLHTLGFSESLCAIPHQAENWLYDSGGELSLTDIVILAKLHRYIGSPQAKTLPYINSIPAYSRLSEGKLDPDFSLAILKKAQQRINAAMRLLS